MIIQTFKTQLTQLYLEKVITKSPKKQLLYGLRKHILKQKPFAGRDNYWSYQLLSYKATTPTMPKFNGKS